MKSVKEVQPPSQDLILRDSLLNVFFSKLDFSVAEEGREDQITFICKSEKNNTLNWII